MTLNRNSKIMIIGVAAFLVGQILWGLVHGQAGTSSAEYSGGDLMWVILQFLGYIWSALCGAFVSWGVSSHRFLTGSSVGVLGILALMLPSLITLQQNIGVAIVAVVMYGLTSALGAIIGSHIGARRSA